MKHEISEDAADRFRSFLSKLVRVPKHEIDEKEREYQKKREAARKSHEKGAPKRNP